MKPSRLLVFVVAMLAVTAIASPTRAVLVIATVPVGNAGNTGEVQSQGTFGAVGYDYRIGTYEVTNDEYATFLNAVAATDSFGLFNASMGSDARGGITQSGASGSFTYAARANMGNKPVNFVSWYDAVRFTNWLHNGQGSGDTETGAYTLMGGTPTPSNGLTVMRELTATWFLPSEDEWYKAAYHKNNGMTGDYFDYPTSSDTAPTVATANATGDISNPGANVSNYANGADWDSNGDSTIEDGNVTTVGSADSDNSMSPHDSTSPYLTFDQGGNVVEWNEALVTSSTRGLRGGAWFNTSAFLLAATRDNTVPTGESSVIGFRVATVSAVPEASQIACGALLVVAALGRALALRVRG